MCVGYFRASLVKSKLANPPDSFQPTDRQTESPGTAADIVPEPGYPSEQTAEAPEAVVAFAALTEREPEAAAPQVKHTSQPKPEPPILTALELTFCDAKGRRLGFRDAVTCGSSGDWSLRPHSRATVQSQGADPRSLGGHPGRCPDYYARRSPSGFGFDADLVLIRSLQEESEPWQEVVVPRDSSALQRG